MGRFIGAPPVGINRYALNGPTDLATKLSKFAHRDISPDGNTIEARWERGMGDAGDRWELDFPITYIRR